MAINADATLVNAAYRMGMANVPVDTSGIFKQQYEALAGIHAAKGQMVESAIKGIGGVLEQAVTTTFQIKDAKDSREWWKRRGDLSMNYLSDNAQNWDTHWENKRQIVDTDTLEHAEEEITAIKSKIEALENGQSSLKNKSDGEGDKNEKELEWLENKAIIIHFERGSAGNLVHRVLGSHDPIYWSYEINNSYEKENNPIKWPKHGYIEIHIDQGCTCHTGHSFIEEAHENRIHDRIFRNSKIHKAMKQNKTIVLLTHVEIRSLNRNIRVLRIVGDENKLKRNHLYNTHVPKQFHKPIIEDNTYNLNINNLVDENYDIFEKGAFEIALE